MCFPATVRFNYITRHSNTQWNWSPLLLFAFATGQWNRIPNCGSETLYEKKEAACLNYYTHKGNLAMKLDAKTDYIY